jgi:hypothetical protein
VSTHFETASDRSKTVTPRQQMKGAAEAASFMSRRERAFETVLGASAAVSRTYFDYRQTITDLEVTNPSI